VAKALASAARSHISMPQAPAERRGQKGVNRNGRISFFLGPSSSLWPWFGFVLGPFTEHKRTARLFLGRDLCTGDREALDCEQAHLDEDRRHPSRYARGPASRPKMGDHYEWDLDLPACRRGPEGSDPGTSFRNLPRPVLHMRPLAPERVEDKAARSGYNCARSISESR
jgi:hypothetical protein